ncbi:methyl-accepting chemotaxis protein [Couchioplanes caeruleus]|uniref:Chemotaxis protein n=2 Tax=Couchioplanes caeruleus TaxID=56438 RepID=A0A1K0FT58_9ACTN|nr:methyl-accepting chemotaxis protein [Couchioplanes caeruleus]OJF11232.1 chemotaxis protein [Couchioplanes caeruleus subsp. caeruleus]OJF15997.1 chemotaxis protein [Couchioplanes caeruleus subsp. caeruleus]ROP27854.1 methyl-accepting chemotaxis protein [Couchioplanes caeruleus]
MKRSTAATRAVEVTVRRNPVVGWLADRSVNVKGLLAAGITALVALGVGALSVGRMSDLSDDLAITKTVHVESLKHLGDLRGGLSDMYAGLLLHSHGDRDPALRTQGRKDVATADAAVDAALAKYQELVATGPQGGHAHTGGVAERRAAMEACAKAIADYRLLRDTVDFGEEPPAGFTPPPVEGISAAFAEVMPRLFGSLAELRSAEDAAATAMADAAAEKYREARAVTIAALLLGLTIAAAVGFAVSRMMARQLRGTSAALDAVATGDLTHPAEVRSSDELGRMAAAVNEARDGIRRTVETLAAGSRTLGDSSQRLTGVTGRIATSAQGAADQANVVATAAGDVSNNVQSVAAGSEQMRSSIREIAQNAQDAARVAADAVGAAEVTNKTVAKLGESSAEIDNVVKAITSIAEQTNLLALNATIEAARAGESGKGFAVVASEVKDLAQETARATEDISRRVEAIQSDTVKAVDTIGEIGRIIARINDYQLTIAAAVEEQTTTAGEMSRSVTEAAGGASDIAANIRGVAASAETTTTELTEAERTAAELARLATDLQSAVGRFRV